jgi:hypothetical protein
MLTIENEGHLKKNISIESTPPVGGTPIKISFLKWSERIITRPNKAFVRLKRSYLTVNI